MFGHTAAYFAIRIVNGALAIAALYILTRLMSPAQYGHYVLGLAALNVGSTILFQWLNASVARFYPAHAAAPEPLLSTAHRLFWRLATAAATITIVLAVLSPWPDIYPSMALAVGAGVVGMGLYNLNLQITNARGEPMHYGLVTATRAATGLAATVGLVLAGLGAAGAVVGVTVGCLMAVVFFGARWNTSAQPNPSVLRRELVVYGVPLALTYVSSMVLDVSDRFLLGWWRGASAVAGYAAAYDLAQQTVGAILNVFFLAAYPRVTAAWESGGPEAARRAMLPLARSLLLAAPLMAGLFIGLAPEITGLMFGSTLRADAARVMPWVAAAVAIGGLRAFLFDIAFHLAKATMLQLRIMALMAAINLLLNLVLIPAHGALGAAIATTIAFSVGTLASAWWSRRVGIYPPMAWDALKAMLALVLLATTLGLTAPEDSTRTTTLLRAGAGLLVFAAVTLGTDLGGVRRLLRRRPAAERNILP